MSPSGSRSATPQVSGIRAWPGWTAKGRASPSRRHSGKRTGRELPSTPQPRRGSPGASERISSSPLSGSASSSRSSLSSVICSSGVTLPSPPRSTATALVVPSSSRSRASSRPVRSSHTPPEQRPGIRATRCGPKAHPATCHSVVTVSDAATAKAARPSGAGGSRKTRTPSSASTPPSWSSPVRGPAAAPVG